VNGNLVTTNLFSLEGDSGSPGFVTNPDGTVSAVGILQGGPDGDDNTTDFVMVDPLLRQWGLRILL
ncbi:MAG TPA: trypsin, partial [Mycobacterium sp.]|nr:trypsin [Mycobacterium sp.]